MIRTRAALKRAIQTAKNRAIRKAYKIDSRIDSYLSELDKLAEKWNDDLSSDFWANNDSIRNSFVGYMEDKDWKSLLKDLEEGKQYIRDATQNIADYVEFMKDFVDKYSELADDEKKKRF